MNRHPIGAPGSVARMLSESPRRFGGRFVLFRYGAGTIDTVAVCDTYANAARYHVADGRHVVVDVASYGCPVPDHPCKEAGCKRLAYTGDDYCGVHTYCNGHPMPSLAP